MAHRKASVKIPRSGTQTPPSRNSSPSIDSANSSPIPVPDRIRRTGAYHHPALSRIDSYSSVWSDAYDLEAEREAARLEAEKWIADTTMDEDEEGHMSDEGTWVNQEDGDDVGMMEDGEDGLDDLFRNGSQDQEGGAVRKSRVNVSESWENETVLVIIDSMLETNDDDIQPIGGEGDERIGGEGGERQGEHERAETPLTPPSAPEVIDEDSQEPPSPRARRSMQALDNILQQVDYFRTQE
ncbi:hypothetical protein HK104_000164, partial [Borealophlyctis nickersoniae]